MARKQRKVKHKSNHFGIAVMWAVSAMVGGVSVAGWLLGPGDVIANRVFAGLAGAAAFVVPIAAGQLGRSRSSWFMLPAAIVFACWTAFSIEHANETLVEAPRKAQHNAEQASQLQAVADAEARAKSLRDKRDALQPEVVNCSPCKFTRQEAAARDAAKRQLVDADIETADGEIEAARKRVKEYHPMAPWQVTLCFGALLDLVIALAIWSLESTARYEKRKAEEQAERDREYRLRQNQMKPQGEPKKRAKRKQAADGPVTDAEQLALLQLRGPYLVVDNG